MQNMESYIDAWDAVKYGWDLRQIGSALLVAPDLNHWAIGHALKMDEDKFARQCEEKGVKVLIYKGTDANRSTGEQFRDFSAKFWWTLGGKLKLLRMCYHWLQYSVDPKEAFYFYKALMDECPTELPYEMDFEETSVKDVGDYIWRAQVWTGLAEEALNDLPVFYTGGWYLQKLRNMIPKTFIQKMGSFRKYPLHLALYDQKFPRKWCEDERWLNYYQPWGLDEWTIWQYTDKADFPYYEDNDSYTGTQWGIPSLGLDVNLIKRAWLQKYLDKFYGQTGTEAGSQEEDQTQTQPDNSFIYVANFKMNLRAGPGTYYEWKGSLEKGSRVELLDIGGEDTWIKTEKGWVCKQLGGDIFMEKQQ